MKKSGSRYKDRFDDDARLKQFYLLEKYYEDKSDSDLVMDFLGPQIDTGFRLSTHATPRKLVISVEVAYLLAAAKMPTSEKFQGIFDWPVIYYDGRREFKGVLGSKPYPLFWIDLHCDSSTAIAEDDLSIKLPKLDNKSIEKFCEKFFDDNNSMMLKPFIYSDHKDQYGDLPENYVACILYLSKTWDDEKKRYEGEFSQVVPKDLGSQSADIDDLVSQLIEALPLIAT